MKCFYSKVFINCCLCCFQGGHFHNQRPQQQRNQYNKPQGHQNNYNNQQSSQPHQPHQQHYNNRGRGGGSRVQGGWNPGDRDQGNQYNRGGGYNNQSGGYYQQNQDDGYSRGRSNYNRGGRR